MISKSDTLKLPLAFAHIKERLNQSLLIFLTCTDKDVQNYLIEKTEEKFKDILKIKKIPFSANNYSPLTHISLSFQNHDKNLYILSDFPFEEFYNNHAQIKEDIKILTGSLNITRDLLPQFNIKCIIICPEQFEDRIKLKAGDFYSFTYFSENFTNEAAFHKKIKSFKRNTKEKEKEERLEHLLKSFKTEQNKTLKAYMLHETADIFYGFSDYHNSLKYAEQALKIYKSRDAKKEESDILNHIGKIYQKLSMYETGLKYSGQSLETAKKLEYKKGVSGSLDTIGSIHINIGDYETALKYLDESLEISKEIGNKSIEGSTLNNISQIFKARGDYETALKYLNESLEISKEIGDKSGEGVTLNNISQIFTVRGDYETALKYLNESLKIRKEIKDTAGFCVTMFNIGHIHLQNQEIQEAMNTWLTVYKTAKQINLAQVLDALENLAHTLGLSGGLDVWERLLKQKS